MQQHNNDQAVAAYIKNIETVRHLLAQLSNQVQAHQDSVGPDEVHWGHVGDMASLAERLSDLMQA